VVNEGLHRKKALWRPSGSCGNWKGCRWHLGQADAGRTCSINLFDRLTPRIHSAAEFFEDPIVLDGLADHGSRILRLGKGQVNESGRVDSISKRLLLQNRDYSAPG